QCLAADTVAATLQATLADCTYMTPILCSWQRFMKCFLGFPNTLNYLLSRSINAIVFPLPFAYMPLCMIGLIISWLLTGMDQMDCRNCEEYCRASQQSCASKLCRYLF